MQEKIIGKKIGMQVMIITILVMILSVFGLIKGGEMMDAGGSPALFIVFIITAIKSSYYQITDKQVILKWGIIKNKIDISDVKEIKFITNTQKLELTFEDDSYFVIAVSSEWKEDFVDELRKTFPKIPYIQETQEDKK